MRAATHSRAVPLATLLRLGRVSSLPTVWTNAMSSAFEPVLSSWGSTSHSGALLAPLTP